MVRSVRSWGKKRLGAPNKRLDGMIGCIGFGVYSIGYG